MKSIRKNNFFLSEKLLELVKRDTAAACEIENFANYINDELNEKESYNDIDVFDGDECGGIFATANNWQRKSDVYITFKNEVYEDDKPRHYVYKYFDFQGMKKAAFS